MRLATLLTTALLVLVPGTAIAHLDHGNCPVGSETVFDFVVHVDRYRVGCLGVTVSLDNADCSVADLHPFGGGFHVLVLWTEDCQTGVILEVLEGDERLLA